MALVDRESEIGIRAGRWGAEDEKRVSLQGNAKSRNHETDAAFAVSAAVDRVGAADGLLDCCVGSWWRQCRDKSAFASGVSIRWRLARLGRMKPKRSGSSGEALGSFARAPMIFRRPAHGR